MEFVRRSVATVGTHLGKLGTTHKLLIGAIVIVMLMTLFIVTQYTGRTTMQEIVIGGTPLDAEIASSKLNAAGIMAKNVNGKLSVPSADYARAAGLLSEQGLLGNKALTFETLVNKPSWTNSRQQNEQLYINALQNELATRIAQFKGVHQATVFLDIPEPTGFGTQMRKPSASVTVTGASGGAISQATVDAIAGFVAGSRAGLAIENVKIIDASTGRQRRVTNESEQAPAMYIEHAALMERQTREKMLDLLSYIPGVTVTVTAHVDVARSEATVLMNMPEKQGTVSLRKKENEDTTSSTAPASGAEPGFGANQTADINRGSSSAGKSETGRTTTEYENHVGTRSEKIIDPKGQATRVAVSVAVPQGYIVRLVKAAADAAKPKDAAAGAAPADKKETVPTDDEVNQRFASEKKRIVDSISPHVKAMTAQSAPGMSEDELKRIVAESIDVALVPVDIPPSTQVTQAGLFGAIAAAPTGGVGGLGAILGGGLFDKAVLAMLSVAALFMMVMMVRKAASRQEMPTAEELVGLPPSLDAESDLVGEAAEGDTAMAGIEVGEGEMQTAKMLDQINSLVDKTPDSAAKLLNRWVNIDS